MIYSSVRVVVFCVHNCDQFMHSCRFGDEMRYWKPSFARIPGDVRVRDKQSEAERASQRTKTIILFTYHFYQTSSASKFERKWRLRGELDAASCQLVLVWASPYRASNIILGNAIIFSGHSDKSFLKHFLEIIDTVRTANEWYRRK